MPGKQVKNWPMYEALRAEGKSKESAARITNSRSKRARGTRSTAKHRGRAKH